jgi:hypothetical protein
MRCCDMKSARWNLHTGTQRKEKSGPFIYTYLYIILKNVYIRIYVKYNIHTLYIYLSSGSSLASISSLSSLADTAVGALEGGSRWKRPDRGTGAASLSLSPVR